MTELPRFPLAPFTNGEVLGALARVMPPGMVDDIRDREALAPEEPCTMWIADETLMVLAAVSPEFAQRVERFRPDLQPRVAEVRLDPESFLVRQKMPSPGGRL